MTVGTEFFLSNGRYVPHVSSLNLSRLQACFLQGRKCDQHFLGQFGIRFVCFGVGDVKSLDEISSQTCLSALCIETVSKVHSCPAKAALKMS